MSWRMFIFILPFYFMVTMCSAALLGSPAANNESAEQEQPSLGIDLTESSSTATVTVAELTVPTKAKKELEKARKAALRLRLVESDHYIAKALRAWPRYCQALTLRSWLALSRNSYEQARIDAEMAVQYDPKDYMALDILADSYMFLNRLDDALRVIDRSIATTPSAWQGYYEKGKLSILRSDWPAALEAATKASSLTKDNAYLHLLRIFAFAGMKDQSGAAREMIVFRSLKPEASWSPQLKRALIGTGTYNIEPPRDAARSDKTSVTSH